MPRQPPKSKHNRSLSLNPDNPELSGNTHIEDDRCTEPKTFREYHDSQPIPSIIQTPCLRVAGLEHGATCAM